MKAAGKTGPRSYLQFGKLENRDIRISGKVVSVGWLAYPTLASKHTT
jgi:hypothetical protein